MKVLLILLPLLFTSCAFLNPPPRDESHQLITGGEKVNDYDLNYLERNLTKKSSRSLGEVTYKLTPLSYPLLKKRVLEKSAQFALANHVIKEEWHGLNQKYLEGRNCFEVHVEAREYDTDALLDNLEVSFTDYNNLKHEMEWESVKHRAIPEAVEKSSYAGPAEKYLNSGIACTKEKFPWQYGFIVQLKSNDAAFYSQSAVEFDYRFNLNPPELITAKNTLVNKTQAPVKNDIQPDPSEKEVAPAETYEEIKKKKRQPYRNW